MSKLFDEMAQGTAEAEAYMEGKRKNYKVATRKPIQADDVTESSGNVFADLGLPNADQELNKARLRLESAGKRRE